jgi:translation initiation factor eIF-2B subunit delta
MDPQSSAAPKQKRQPQGQQPPRADQPTAPRKGKGRPPATEPTEKPQSHPPAAAAAQKSQKQATQSKQTSTKASFDEKPSPPLPSPIERLFSHIPVVRRLSSREFLDGLKKPSDRDAIHPALLEFQMQDATDFSIDEDERTRRFMRMMMQQVRDEPLGDDPSQKGWFLPLIMRTMEFLYSSDKRMTPIGVGNAVRFLKEQTPDQDRRFIGQSREVEERRKAYLLAAIQHFIEDRIDEVSDFLSRSLSQSILEDDVILTYGWSSIICNALKIAQKKPVRFRVIIVDSRPNFDTRQLVDRIPELDVRYTLMSGLSYVMPEVKKVLIEPCGILSNNAALTPIGTAMIAMVAHHSGVPVIMPCPSYRFVNKVSIDGLARNEILAPEFLKSRPKAEDVKADYLALVYDVTPGQYVDIVKCEVGDLPVNSISAMMKVIQDRYRPAIHKPV